MAETMRHNWGRGGNPPGPIVRVGGAKHRVLELVGLPLGGGMPMRSEPLTRALDLTSDRTRLADYFDGLTFDAAKRAEFREVLAQVDIPFVRHVLRSLPAGRVRDAEGQRVRCDYRKDSKARATRTTARQRRSAAPRS